MDTISYAIFNECYYDALGFKHDWLEYYQKELVLNYHFRADTKAVLMQSLASEKASSRLPEILLISFPFHSVDSQTVISSVKAAYPEIKILALSKTENKKLIAIAFHQGANGVLSAAGRFEAKAREIIDACQYLMRHEHLNNQYFEFYVKRMEEDKNFFGGEKYVPEELDIKIAEGIRNGDTEKEMADNIGETINIIKHRIEDINDEIGNDKRKSIGIALWFIRHGYISDGFEDAA